MLKPLRWAHSKMPEKIKNLYAPALNWRYKIYKFRFFDTRLPIRIFEGKAKESSLPFCLVHVGRYPATGHRWAKKMLAEGYITHQIKPTWFFNIERTLRGKGFDYGMLLFETNFLTRTFLRKKKGFKVPLWMQMAIDISPPTEKLRGNTDTGIGNIVRRIKKHDLSYEITKDYAFFDEFYYKMHLPLIKNRFNEASEVFTYEQAKEIFSYSDLLLVKQSDLPIAANFISYMKKGPTLRCMGILNGDMEYIRIGAAGAIYYFAILHLKKQGFKEMNVGGTSPILTDGLTTFKIRIRAKIIPHTHISKRCFYMLLRKDSPQLRDILGQNPFVFYPTGYQPHRALFIDAEKIETQKDFNRIIRATKAPGLKGTYLYLLKEDARIHNWIKELKDKTIKMMPAAKIFNNQ